MTILELARNDANAPDFQPADEVIEFGGQFSHRLRVAGIVGYAGKRVQVHAAQVLGATCDNCIWNGIDDHRNFVCHSCTLAAADP